MPDSQEPVAGRRGQQVKGAGQDDEGGMRGYRGGRSGSRPSQPARVKQAGASCGRGGCSAPCPPWGMKVLSPGGCCSRRRAARCRACRRVRAAGGKHVASRRSQRPRLPHWCSHLLSLHTSQCSSAERPAAGAARARARGWCQQQAAGSRGGSGGGGGSRSPRACARPACDQSPPGQYRHARSPIRQGGEPRQRGRRTQGRPATRPPPAAWPGLP